MGHKWTVQHACQPFGEHAWLEIPATQEIHSVLPPTEMTWLPYDPPPWPQYPGIEYAGTQVQRARDQ